MPEGIYISGRMIFIKRKRWDGIMELYGYILHTNPYDDDPDNEKYDPLIAIKNAKI